MSVHGGVERAATVLSFEWRKYMDEYNGILDNTWHLKITAGPLDISIERIPNRKHFSMKYGMCGFGYWISFNRNYETFEKRTFGDGHKGLLKK